MKGGNAHIWYSGMWSKTRPRVVLLILQVPGCFIIVSWLWGSYISLWSGWSLSAFIPENSETCSYSLSNGLVSLSLSRTLFITPTEEHLDLHHFISTSFSLIVTYFIKASCLSSKSGKSHTLTLSQYDVSTDGVLTVGWTKHQTNKHPYFLYTKLLRLIELMTRSNSIKLQWQHVNISSFN